MPLESAAIGKGVKAHREDQKNNTDGLCELFHGSPILPQQMDYWRI
jgi:hypothetical protein